MKAKILERLEHFDLHEITGGVYLACAGESGAAIGNAGIVDLGNQTLIFDTFETPQAGRQLRHVAERLTGRVATIVVNSHAHPDHWFGNQAFLPEATIIATHQTRAAMIPLKEEAEASREQPEEWQEWLLEEQGRLERETDPARTTSITLTIRRIQASMTALQELALELPTLTFDGKLRFAGKRRSAELMTLGPGHTSSDAFLLLPDENLVFTGDLAFFQRQPYMADCDLEAWLARLDFLEGLQAHVYAPGHGTPGTIEDIRLLSQYFTAMEALVRSAIEVGEPLESIVRLPLPQPFTGWSREGTILEANARYLHAHVGGRDEPAGG